MTYYRHRNVDGLQRAITDFGIIILLPSVDVGYYEIKPFLAIQFFQHVLSINPPRPVPMSPMDTKTKIENRNASVRECMGIKS